MVKVFPVMRAAVTFSVRGYEAMFGWAQAVSHIHGDGVEKRFTVDLAPSVQGNDFPCCEVGYKPSTLDAPCNRPRTDMAWRAYTFLFRFISQPRREPSRRVYPIVGFMRGYVLSDRGKKVAVTEFREMGASEWERIFPRCLRKFQGGMLWRRRTRCRQSPDGAVNPRRGQDFPCSFDTVPMMNERRKVPQHHPMERSAWNRTRSGSEPSTGPTGPGAFSQLEAVSK